MKKLELVNGGYALVDNEDYPKLKDYRWFKVQIPGGHTPYVLRRFTEDGESKKVYLHKQIMGVPLGSEFEVDHENRNGLDCRRKNLRVLTTAENQENTKVRTDSSSGYRGVYFHKGAGKWRAKIDLRGKRVHLGLYTNKNKAAYAYNVASEILHQYGRPNKISPSRLPSRGDRVKIKRKVKEFIDRSGVLE